MDLLSRIGTFFADPANWEGADGIVTRLVEHLQLSLTATLIAAVLALPPALWLAHRRRAEFLANAVVNVGRAVPSFGILVLVTLLFIEAGGSARFWPIVIATVALGMPPMFTNTYTAVADVEPATIDAARGMGLSEREVLLRIELPISAPVVLAGVRIAFVQIIATVTLGAIVGPGGGFGRYIIDGFARFRQGGDAEMFAGALLVSVLTITAERAFTLTERLILPAGVSRLVRTADVAETAGVG